MVAGALARSRQPPNKHEVGGSFFFFFFFFQSLVVSGPSTCCLLWVGGYVPYVCEHSMYVYVVGGRIP